MTFDDPLDPHQLRARVLQRLEPQFRLQKHRLQLIAHIIIFVVAQVLIYSFSGSIFFTAITDTFTSPDGSPVETFTHFEPTPATIAFSVIWFGLLTAHAVYIFMLHSRERMIRREMDREYDLEKMRLEVELAREHGQNDQGVLRSGKPKRAMRLSDDGELNMGEDDLHHPLAQQKKNSGV